MGGGASLCRGGGEARAEAPAPVRVAEPRESVAPTPAQRARFERSLTKDHGAEPKVVTLEPKAVAARRRRSVAHVKRLYGRSKSRIAGAIEDFASSREAAEMEGPDGTNMLQHRLGRLGLVMESIAADGNCQFRSLAHQLFGTQERHEEVRARCVEHMRKQNQEFGVFFDTTRELNGYLAEMALSRTWGDELTLRAACDAYHVRVHVIQSTDEHWYIVYVPSEQKEGAPKWATNVFLAYISPVHYQSIVEESAAGDPWAASGPGVPHAGPAASPGRL